MILDGKSAIIIPFYIRRCVGMADEGDSKSLVLITRVGSTPTTGTDIRPQKAQSFLGSFFGMVMGVEQGGTAKPRTKVSGGDF